MDQAERLESLGRMAAGMAHELNNPLTAILGFTQILLKSSPLTPQQREDLECILEQTRRCSGIIKDLTHFARKRPPEMQPTDLPVLLDSAVRAFQADDHALEIRKEYPSSLPAVRADPAHLQQLFLHLIRNAAHAARDRKPGLLVIRAWSEEGRARLSLSDNGCGIPQEHLPHIFDPFFTTKPVGQGTGLGLAIAYGIVQEHRGSIRAQSAAGQGTTFLLELPEVDSVAAARPASP